MTDIKGFFNDYRFLSNFWYASFTIGGAQFDTVEHYFQSMKAKNPEDANEIASAPSPAAAKRLGKKVELRDDWEQIKIGVMSRAVEAKFRQNNDLKDALLATGNAYLEETNHWGDKFWGVCGGEGKNWLGIILMQVRELLRNERFYD